MADQEEPGRTGAQAGAFKDADVEVVVKDAVPLTDFMESRTPGPLSVDQCLHIVEEAIQLLEGLYVHLPLKRGMYAADPVRRLRLLQLRLERSRSSKQQDTAGTGEAPPAWDDLWFHREMTDTFTSVRDLHTAYVLPDPFNRAIALLPFQIEDYFDGARRGFLVSNVMDGLDWFTAPADFRPGVEVTHWNGVPIRRAVELAGERNAGGNPDARLARGLARLTVRPLAKSLPPDEEWVSVVYRPAPGGETRSVRVRWHVVQLQTGEAPPPDGATLRQATGLGLDEEADTMRLVRRDTFAAKRRHAAASPLFEAKVLTVDGRQYGYIRIRSFKEANSNKLLGDFATALERMPGTGLILDVRDNPGGYITTGERLLQLLTPSPIQPEPLQFINSNLSLKVCNLLSEFAPWVGSIERALETSTTFSAGLPLTQVERCNDIGQRYYGPVVLITNALCYSTTDIFVAGFQDHNIGIVLGTDGRTGAGGANVITRSGLRGRYEATKRAHEIVGIEPPVWPLREEPLPLNADLRIALRRTLRVGKRSGAELEDLGVVPDKHHFMTRDDVLHGNPDLIARAAGLLSQSRSCDLREVSVTVDGASGNRVIKAVIQTRGIEWLDVLVDGWASGSRRVADGCNRVEAAQRPGGKARFLALRGYRTEAEQPKLVASRRISLRTAREAAAVPGPGH